MLWWQSLTIVTFWHFCLKVQRQGFQKTFLAFHSLRLLFYSPCLQCGRSGGLSTMLLLDTFNVNADFLQAHQKHIYFSLCYHQLSSMSMFKNENIAFHEKRCKMEKSLWGSVVGRKHSLMAGGAECGGRQDEGPATRLQPAPRTPTNIHVNCSLREINTSDKLPMPLSGAVMKVYYNQCVCVCGGVVCIDKTKL